MTSASELFYNRRSRSGNRKNSESHLGLDPTLPSDEVYPDLLRHSRRRRPPRRRAFQTDREPVRLDNSGPHDSETGNSSNGGIASSRVNRLTLIRNDRANDRLPGAVLQARARLLERLGISLTGNRQNSVASSISWDELAVSDDFVVINSGNWETEAPREWLDSSTRFTDLTPEANQAVSPQNVSKKKPPGLCWEAVCNLPQEFFKDGEESDGVLRASLECCICLERFWEGDRLFRLPCDHKFHSACLEPWLRTCGECPYCRASI